MSNIKRHSIIRVEDPDSDGPNDEDEDEEDPLDQDDDIPDDNLKANTVCLTPRKSDLNRSFEAWPKVADRWNGFEPAR